MVFEYLLSQSAAFDQYVTLDNIGAVCLVAMRDSMTEPAGNSVNVVAGAVAACDVVAGTAGERF